MALAPPLLAACGVVGMRDGAFAGYSPQAPATPTADANAVAHQQAQLAEMQRLRQLRQLRAQQQLLQQQMEQLQAQQTQKCKQLQNAIGDPHSPGGMCPPGECVACDAWAAASDQAALKQQRVLLHRREQQLRLLQQQALIEQPGCFHQQAFTDARLDSFAPAITPQRRPLAPATPPTAAWRRYQDGDSTECCAAQFHSGSIAQSRRPAEFVRPAGETPMDVGSSSASSSIAAWRETRSLTESLGGGAEVEQPASLGRGTSAAALPSQHVSLASAAAAAEAARGERNLWPRGYGGSVTPSERGDVSSGFGSITPPRQRPVGLGANNRLAGKEPAGLPRMPSMLSASSTHVVSQSELASVAPSISTAALSNTWRSHLSVSQSGTPPAPMMPPAIGHTSPRFAHQDAPQDAAGMQGRVQWLQAERDALECWLSSSSTAWEILEKRTEALRESRERHLHHLEQHAEELQHARQTEQEQLFQELKQRRQSHERLQEQADELTTALVAAEGQLQQQARQAQRSNCQPKAASVEEARAKPWRRNRHRSPSEDFAAPKSHDQLAQRERSLERGDNDTARPQKKQSVFAVDAGKRKVSVNLLAVERKSLKASGKRDSKRSIVQPQEPETIAVQAFETHRQVAEMGSVLPAKVEESSSVVGKVSLAIPAIARYSSVDADRHREEGDVTRAQAGEHSAVVGQVSSAVPSRAESSRRSEFKEGDVTRAQAEEHSIIVGQVSPAVPSRAESSRRSELKEPQSLGARDVTGMGSSRRSSESDVVSEIEELGDAVSRYSVSQLREIWARPPNVDSGTAQKGSGSASPTSDTSSELAAGLGLNQKEVADAIALLNRTTGAQAATQKRPSALSPVAEVDMRALAELSP